MSVATQLPTIITIVLTAGIDSINPCAIGVLILMVSVMLAGGSSTRKMLLYGFVYVGAVMLTYLLAGLGLLYFLASIPLVVTEYLSIAVGLLIIIAGLLEVKDYFWYGQGFSLAIPTRFAKHMHEKAQSSSTLWGIAMLGAFVSAVELPCTGAPYLAIITLLSQYFDFTAFLLLVLYNIIFVAPLIIILVAVAMGAKIEVFKQWKQEARGTMRLAIGLLLISLGWLLMLIANGTINFG